MKTTSVFARHRTLESECRTWRLVRDSQCSSKLTHVTGIGVSQVGAVMTDISKSLSYRARTRIILFLNFSGNLRTSQKVVVWALAIASLVTLGASALCGWMVHVAAKQTVQVITRLLTDEDMPGILACLLDVTLPHCKGNHSRLLSVCKSRCTLRLLATFPSGTVLCGGAHGSSSPADCLRTVR